jgi:hypothetical protein
MKIEVTPTVNEPKTIREHNKYPVLGILESTGKIALFLNSLEAIVLDGGGSCARCGDIISSQDKNSWVVCNQKVSLSND